MNFFILSSNMHFGSEVWGDKGHVRWWLETLAYLCPSPLCGVAGCRWGEGHGRECVLLHIGVRPRRGHPWLGWQQHAAFGANSEGASWPSLNWVPIISCRHGSLNSLGFHLPSFRTLDRGKTRLTSPLSAWIPHFHFVLGTPQHI